jgi:hypothetical protein
MRPIHFWLTFAALGCSKAAGPAVDSPTVALAPAASTAPAIAPASSQAQVTAAPPPSIHVVRLPDQPYDEELPSPRSIDIAAGDPPGPRFQAGTVYVATLGSVTEWDLAAGLVVRTVQLPVSPGEVAPWILRAGDRLRVLVSGGESTSFFQLTPELGIEHAERWVGHVLHPGIEAFGADPGLTAVMYSGNAEHMPHEDDDGVVLVTFDGAGRHLATRVLEPLDVGVDERAVVVDGRLFALLSRQDKGVDLVKLSPDLKVEKRTRVSRGADATLTLREKDGRLEVVSGDSIRAIEFSTNLDELGPSTVMERPADLMLGHEAVRLCRHRGRAWLAWTTTSQNACTPDSPPARP